ncbi:major facilitator superfamily MFS_1 [Heyndrickxia coagulans]|uniref:Major facilitator superfamily protein n=1 Tax=Heyndrickxia coagulans TaxID=1398 RepID=A0AAN0WBN0_HEYCO|nr:major facilitator superfamily protein [Heyndrickxia coagulans]AKN56279.1 major facilitator superfamily MFS_1 [Heyndrickxia coagulans]
MSCPKINEIGKYLPTKTTKVYLLSIEIHLDIPSWENCLLPTFVRFSSRIQVLINSRILLSISISTAILNFCRTAFETIYILYIVRNVGMHASQIGLIYGLGSIGGIIGAYFSEFISKKMGIGISIIGATVLIGVGGIIVFTPYFHSKTIALILLTLGQMLSGFGNMLYFVSQVSLRQAITPLKILGSVNASNRFITRGAMPLGASLEAFLARI